MSYALTVMMPYETHKETDTFRGRNSQDKILNDSKDLNKAKDKDAKKLKEFLDEDDKKNPQNKECNDKIRKALDSDEMKKYNPEKEIDKHIKNNRDCNKQMSARWREFVKKYKNL